MDKVVLSDVRWYGDHGIGRFAREVLGRIPESSPLNLRSPLLHPLELAEVVGSLLKAKHKVYFSPGYNPPIWSPIPFVFTIHDLNHLQFKENSSILKNLYYRKVMRRACVNAARVLTVSEFSRNSILQWSGVPDTQVVNVGNGVSESFSSYGDVWDPGFPYFFYIGNRKPHKNIPRLIHAFHVSGCWKESRLVLSGFGDQATMSLISKLGLDDYVLFAGSISEDDLPRYYRGSVALVFPSLYEGFGLPVVEAMACGTAVITSNVAALPEVAGDAALLVDPYDVNELASAMSKMLYDQELRSSLGKKGVLRASQYRWDDVAARVRSVLLGAAREND